MTDNTPSSSRPTEGQTGLSRRLSRLERDVAELKAELQALLDDLPVLDDEEQK